MIFGLDFGTLDLGLTIGIKDLGISVEALNKEEINRIYDKAPHFLSKKTKKKK